MTRLALVLHFFPPWRSAGSETVAVELGRAAVAAGHEVQVWVTHQDAQNNWRGNEPDVVFEGMTVHRVRNVILAGNAVKRWRPDVVFSHHDHSTYSIRLARTISARSVIAVHNDMDLNQRPIQLNPDMILFNSAWVADSLSRFGSPKASMTFHPPLTPDRHKVESTGEHVTLINLNRDKGAEIFYDLAARMPDTKFLGVIGGHGDQIIRRNLPNVTIMEHGPDMKRVWSQTRVLLMPSVYESYGLVAVEAGINGIPTIANPTPGLRENLGECGIFVDRDDEPMLWVEEIESLLMDQPYYDVASKYSKERAQLALDSTRQTLKQWCDWLG